MTFLSVLIIATCFLAYANGANDNFKGVATLFGSGTSSYRNAISWATITAFLVIFASQLGVPVSTTHVSVGAVSGIGAMTRQADMSVIAHIALSWLLTLPIAAFFSAGIYGLLSLNHL